MSTFTYVAFLLATAMLATAGQQHDPAGSEPADKRTLAALERVLARWELDGSGRMKSLDLSGDQSTDEVMVHLKKLTDLEKLGISSRKVTDAGVVHLNGLTKITWLDLRHTQL